MPAKSKITSNNNDNNKPPIIIPFDINERPVPNYSSYVKRNSHLIVERTTNNREYLQDSEYLAHSASLVYGTPMNSQLQTEPNTRDLKKQSDQVQQKELTRILGPDYSDQFKSPYDTVDLIRFHEALRDDGILQACLDFLIQFMLGDRLKTIVDVNSEFDTEEEANEALKFYSNNPQIRSYKRKLDQINRELKFQIHLFSLLIQNLGFGRACGIIEKSDIDGLPIAIKVLPSMHLGQVYVHRKTWAVLGVEHLDFKFPESIIKAEDMIYFANRNHNISPGTFQYGLSILERVVDLSELNRITDQRNLKEINYRLWAAFLLVKIPGSFNEEIMKEIADDLAKGAGNSIVINQAAEVEVQQIGHDMEKLLDERKDNNREKIRQLQVPPILFDPDILNRATSQELMEAWNVSTLRAYRSWLKDIIQDQWINPILKTLIENERNAAREAQTESGLKGLIEQSQPEPEEDNPLSTIPSETNKQPNIKREVIPIEAIDPATNEVIPYRLPWKIKMEPDPISFDTSKERAEEAILLKNNGLMTLTTAMKRIGITDENEIAQLLEQAEKREKEREQIAKATEEEVREDLNQPNRQQSVEKQREKLTENLRKAITAQNKGVTGSRKPISE